MIDIKTIDEKLDEILKILNGNGKIGMCAKVTIMWTVGIWVISIVGVQAVILVRMLLVE